MYLVELLPIKRKVHSELLTYFSKENIKPGTLVEGAFRKQKIKGVVINLYPVSNNKLAIKTANFNLRKIVQIFSIQPFNNSFIETCSQFAKENFLPLKEIYNNFTTENLLHLPAQETIPNIGHKVHVIEGDLSFRFSVYRKIIKKNTENKKDTWIVCPTNNDVYAMHVLCKKNTIESIQLQAKKKIPSKIKNPSVYISTPSFASFPFGNLGSVILEKEASHFYYTRNNIHADEFITLLVKNKNIPLYKGDRFLSLETALHIKDKNYDVESQEKPVDLVIKNTKSLSTALHNETLALIEKSIENKESVFCLAIRKGYAGITYCRDCEAQINCPNCKHGLNLHNKSGEYIFLCETCGKTYQTKITCPNCGSWNLYSLGVGVEKVYEELKKSFPNKVLYIQTEKDISGKDMSGKIIVGTEKILLLLKEKVDVSIVASFETIFSIPSVTTEIRILETIARIEEKTKKKIIIQSRDPERVFLKLLEKNDFKSIYKNLLAERQELQYPPYKNIWKIKKEIIKNNLHEDKKLLESTKNIIGISLIKKANKVYLQGIANSPSIEILTLLNERNFTLIKNPDQLF